MNKRITFLLIALGVSAQGWAQDEWDALRYSRQTTGGTARTQAIGGAAGSLGGDITATHVNPAGLGFYKTSEVVITPGFYFKKNQSEYLGLETSANKSGMMLGGGGVVFGLPSRNSGGKWRNMAVALSYNRLANFNNTTQIRGINSTTSLTDRWAEDLDNNGRPVSDEDAQYGFPLGASLGYWNSLVAKDNNGVYRSFVPVTQGNYQQDLVKETGGLNEFSIGLGGNYNDKLYIGASLNFPTIRYERNRTFAEDDNTDEDNDFVYLEYAENLTTEAVGFNAKLGLIYSPIPSLRLGLSYHTPSWFNMRDQSTASLQNDLEGFQPAPPAEPIQYPLYIESGELTDGYPVDYEYKLRTPSRALASVSYIFGTDADVSKQQGFITADVEYVNYAGTKYNFSKGPNPDPAFANSLNQVIKDTYKGAMNFRVGGEMKFTVLAVRAGFAYYGNPYNEGDIDASIKRVSGGVGYRNKGFFVDLTYVHTLNGNDIYQPYALQATTVEAASIRPSGGNVLATIGFKF